VDALVTLVSLSHDASFVLNEELNRTSLSWDTQDSTCEE